MDALPVATGSVFSYRDYWIYDDIIMEAEMFYSENMYKLYRHDGCTTVTPNALPM